MEESHGTPFKLRSGNSPLHESFFKAGGKRKRKKQLQKIAQEEKEALTLKIKEHEKATTEGYIDPDAYKNQKAYLMAKRNQEVQKENEKRTGVVVDEDTEEAKRRIRHGEVKVVSEGGTSTKDLSGEAGKKAVGKTAQDIANQKKIDINK